MPYVSFSPPKFICTKHSSKYESGGTFMYYLNRATFITLYTTNVMFASLLWLKGTVHLAMIFLVCYTGGTILIDCRIRHRFIIPSTQLALANARILDEKYKVSILENALHCLMLTVAILRKMKKKRKEKSDITLLWLTTYLNLIRWKIFLMIQGLEIVSA